MERVLRSCGLVPDLRVLPRRVVLCWLCNDIDLSCEGSYRAVVCTMQLQVTLPLGTTILRRAVVSACGDVLGSEMRRRTTAFLSEGSWDNVQARSATYDATHVGLQLVCLRVGATWRRGEHDLGELLSHGDAGTRASRGGRHPRARGHKRRNDRCRIRSTEIVDILRGSSLQQTRHRKKSTHVL